jgi:Fe-S-cluster containining protein
MKSECSIRRKKSFQAMCLDSLNSAVHTASMVRPKVTREEFEQIECNRCGACCEKLWLPSPLRLAEFLSAAESVINPSPEWQLENERFIAWLSALEPTGKVKRWASEEDEATHQYCCTRFERDASGAGFCTAYEDRPQACRNFPNGEPVWAEGFEECSYNVEIVGSSPLKRLRRWLPFFGP